MAEKGKSRRITPIIIIVASMALAILVLVAIVVIQFNKNNSVPVVPETAGNLSGLVNRGFVDSSNSDVVVTDMEDKVAKGMFECEMTTEWTFGNGTSTSKDAYVANSVHNSSTICFDVYRRDNNELIYSSPLIPVGEELIGIKLDKELDAGEYKALVQYRLLDENYEEISTAGFVITITVLR